MAADDDYAEYDNQETYEDSYEPDPQLMERLEEDYPQDEVEYDDLDQDDLVPEAYQDDALEESAGVITQEILLDQSLAGEENDSEEVEQ